MKLLTPVTMLYSSHEGWDELAQSHPSLLQTFSRLVLPASLLGSAMVLYAARFHGLVYAPSLSFAYWQNIAVLFLLLGWGCTHLMAYVIQHSVHTPARAPYADCYRLAAIAPLPIWLSSLTLFVPNPFFNVLCACAGLLASGALLYHGLDRFFEHDDSVATLSMAYTVFSVGALLWTFAVALLVLPLF